MIKLKDYFSCGWLVECIAILPSISFNWMITKDGTSWELNFAWILWYFSIGNVKIRLKNYGY